MAGACVQRIMCHRPLPAVRLEWPKRSELPSSLWPPTFRSMWPRWCDGRSSFRHQKCPCNDDRREHRRRCQGRIKLQHSSLESSSFTQPKSGSGAAWCYRRARSIKSTSGWRLGNEVLAAQVPWKPERLVRQTWLSWHVTVATRKMVATQQLQMMTFAHVFQSCSQDSNAVMEDVIGELKAIMPTLKTVIYRQDWVLPKRSNDNRRIESHSSPRSNSQTTWLFRPPGWKGACDRKAATFKAHMRIHLNEGNEIENAAQMVDAMRSCGGVSGLHVTLCEMENPRTSANVKFDGVSAVSNVEYGEDCITTWKAYGIGPGKTVKLSKFSRGNNETPIPKLSKCVEDVVEDKFTSLQSRLSKPETISSSDESPDDIASSDRAEKRLRMRHWRPSRRGTWRENIDLSNTFRMKDPRVSWLRSKISAGVQLWNCGVQEICVITLTGRSFAKVWSLSGLPESYLR